MTIKAREGFWPDAIAKAKMAVVREDRDGAVINAIPLFL